MRQNTYSVTYFDTFNAHIRETFTIAVDDPMMIEQALRNKVAELQRARGRMAMGHLESISLLDSTEVADQQAHANIVFANDKSVWKEGSRHLVRNSTEGEVVFYVAYCKEGVLYDQESDLPVEWHDNAELLWTTPLA